MRLIGSALVWLLAKCGTRAVISGEDADQLTWSVSNMARRKRSRGGGGGGGGWGSWLVGLIIVLFLAYVGMSFISSFQPTLGNLTYGGEGLGATIFGLVQTWMLPLALLGLLIYVLLHFLGGGGRR